MPTLLFLRIAALLSVLVLVLQFVTAGQLVQQNFGALEGHEVGAIALHVTSGLTALAAFAHWRATRGPVWPLVLSVIVFGITFAQAWTGSHMSLAVHVPAALVTTVTIVWLAAWAVGGAGSRGGRLAR